MTTGEWLQEAASTLRAAGVPAPARDALLLLSDALGRDKAYLLAHPERPLGGAEVAGLQGLLERRRRREPLQYIRGFQEFWGRRVKVGPGCLIPRPETEHLVEEALRLLASQASPRVAELGTGSGCVLMALALERPDAALYGLERDPRALAWSRLNLAGEPGVSLFPGDMAQEPPLEGLDAVLCNPPYITGEEWEELPPEVRCFEPEEALRCGPDPLGPYRQAGRWASRALRPGGSLLCELGVAQARRAAALRRLHPEMRWVRGVRDLAGRLRVAIWRRETLRKPASLGP